MSPEANRLLCPHPVDMTGGPRTFVSDGKCGANASLYCIPIALAEMADHRQFGAMGCQYVRSETGRCAKSGGLPVQQNVICGRECSGQLRGENSDRHIWAFHKVSTARDHYGRADFGFKGAYQNPNHYVTRCQFGSSDSSASRRLREAALNSFRSSSDQESDQSIFRFGVSPANRSARADSSAAASGARRRKASTSGSLQDIGGLRGWPPRPRFTGRPHPSEE